MRPLCSMLLLLTSFQVLLYAQQATKEFTHQVMWTLKRVGSPVPSPDGRWIVFSVTEPAYEEKDQVSDLWIVPTDRSQPARRLTASRGAESGVEWSPDSTRIAFVAKREADEVSQIYILGITEPGEAWRLTNLSTGARAPRWSPDGKRIAFTSDVYPGTRNDEENRKVAAERKALKYRVRAYDGFPIRQWDRWLDDLRPHLFLTEVAPNSQARDLLADSELVKAPGYYGRAELSGSELDAVWTPDGQALIFSATTTHHTQAYANSTLHLYCLTLGTTEPRRLTQSNANFAAPRFSPDGKKLYCLYEPENEYVYNLKRLVYFNWPDLGDMHLVTEGFDRDLSSYAFAGETIYLTAEDAGHEKLYRVKASGGKPELVIDLKLGCYSDLRVPERAQGLYASWESASSPKEIVRIDPSKGVHIALTEFNKEEVAALALPPVKHFWFKSKAGRMIHNMLVLPQNFDPKRKYPLLNLIHGGPHNMWRDQFIIRWNYHLLAQPGFVVLLTNYTGSTGFGEQFARYIQGDPLDGPGKELNEAADEAIRLYDFIDPTRQAAGGASYGGHLANWLEATTTRYRCLISHAGLINLESQWGTSDTIYGREVSNGGPHWEGGKVWREQNPAKYAQNFKTPMLVTVGENDFRVPLNQSLENWSILQRMKVPSRLLVFPDENHWITKGENSRYFYKEVHDWLSKYLLTSPGQ